MKRKAKTAFGGCVALLLAAAAPALGETPLERAERVSGGDDPETRYLITRRGGDFDVVHQGANTERNPRVYAFGDACREGVAHFVVHSDAGASGSRRVVNSLPRLLGAKVYPEDPVSQSPAWSGVLAGIAAKCPGAEAVLLTHTYQTPEKFRAQPKPAVAYHDGRIQTRYAVDLSDPDDSWREVSVGGRPTMDFFEAYYYSTSGKGHVPGRSCDNLVEPGRNNCPVALMAEEGEGHVCTRDDAFCIVIPRSICENMGGTIGSSERKCIQTDYKARMLAGILKRMRDNPDHAERVAALTRDERLAAIEEAARYAAGFIVYTIREVPEELFSYCPLTTDPPDQLVALNRLKFAPGVYKVSMEELQARRPDLVESAEDLCTLNEMCLSLAFRDGNADILDVARTGTRSKLCRSANLPMTQLKLDLIEVAETARMLHERYRGSDQLNALAAILGAIERHRELKSIAETLNGYLPAFEAALLEGFGLRVGAARELVAATRR